MEDKGRDLGGKGRLCGGSRVRDDRWRVEWSSRVEDGVSSVVVADGGGAAAALRARRRAGARKQSPPTAPYGNISQFTRWPARRKSDTGVDRTTNSAGQSCSAASTSAYSCVARWSGRDRGAVLSRKLTLSGLNRPSGSMPCFIVLISCTVPTPSSCTRNCFFPRPTPCSPVPGENERMCRLFVNNT
jgi:hypothetical protein